MIKFFVVLKFFTVYFSILLTYDITNEATNKLIPSFARTNTDDFLSTRSFSYKKRPQGSPAVGLLGIMMRHRIYPLLGKSLRHHQYLFTLVIFNSVSKYNNIFNPKA